MSQSTTQSNSLNGGLLKVFVRGTIILETIALLDRVMESGIEFGRPDMYQAWHLTPLSAAMFIIVFIAIALGTFTAIFASVSLTAKTSEEIDDVAASRKSKARMHELKMLKERRKRYIFFMSMAGLVFIVFNIVFFLHWEGLGAAVDILAPFANFVIIGLTERDMYKESPQQAVMRVAESKIIEAAKGVNTGDGLLSNEASKLLTAAQSRDMEGMLDAITTHDEDEIWLSIRDICERLGVATNFDGPNYQKIARYVTKAKKDGVPVHKRKRDGSLVTVFPASKWYQYFGNYQPALEMIQLTA